MCRSPYDLPWMNRFKCAWPNLSCLRCISAQTSAGHAELERAHVLAGACPLHAGTEPAEAKPTTLVPTTARDGALLGEFAWAQPARQQCLLVQGLSHYLEHMLFMGSAKFPDENSYDAFLSAHAGSSNAYTELVRCSKAGKAVACLIVWTRWQPLT